MSKNLWEDETPGRENIRFVWKYYVLAFAGLGMLWLRQKTAAPLSTVLAVAGALCFFAGVFLTLYWDRKRKKALEEENNKK
jgi:Na+/proline symporter